MTTPARTPGWRRTLRPLLQGALIGAGLALLAVSLLTIVTRQAPFRSSVVALPSPAIAPAATPFGRGDVSVALGPDGLVGLVPLGLDEAHALIMLNAAFGLPNEDVSFPCVDPTGEMRSVRWADLTAFFMDEKFVGFLDGLHYPNDGHPLELTTAEGIGMGTPRNALVAAYGDRLKVVPPPDGVQGDVEGFQVDDGRLSGLIEGDDETGVVIMVRAGVACFPESP